MGMWHSWSQWDSFSGSSWKLMRKEHCLSEEVTSSMCLEDISGHLCRLLENLPEETKPIKRKNSQEICSVEAMLFFGFPRNTCQSILLRKCSLKKCWLTGSPGDTRWPLGAPSPRIGSLILWTGKWSWDSGIPWPWSPDVSVTTCFTELMSQAVLNLCASFKLAPLPGESLLLSST